MKRKRCRYNSDNACNAGCKDHKTCFPKTYSKVSEYVRRTFPAHKEFVYVRTSKPSIREFFVNGKGEVDYSVINWASAEFDIVVPSVKKRDSVFSRKGGDAFVS